MALRLFEQATHAQLYSQFRPTYPKVVLETIHKFIAKHGGGKAGLAVDVACGSGQSTFHLCNHFDQCIGVDISHSQVAEGKKKAGELGVRNVEFKVGDVANLPVEDSSVDLLACAQAWHWLDPEDLYREADRVLKTQGCLAVYGYGNCKLVNKECGLLVSHFYTHTLQGYWHAKRRHIDDLYRQCRLPYVITERFDMEFPTSMELQGFIGYLSSWSGYRNYLDKNPENVVLAKLEESIRTILQPTARDQPVQVDMVFPIFLILGLKDQKK